MKKLVLLVALILASPTAFCAGQFEPYEIKAGFSYYSNEYTSTNGLSALGEEKNFEDL